MPGRHAPRSTKASICSPSSGSWSARRRASSSRSKRSLTAARSPSAPCSDTSATTKFGRRSPGYSRATLPCTANESPCDNPSPGSGRSDMPKIPDGVRGAVITGWGSALPPKVLTNVDLEQMFDTSDEWIVELTGIRERHVGGTTVGLSIESGRKALEMSGVDPAEIDGLVLATTTPDRAVPASSVGVQNELGLGCGAFDITAACSGFVYGLVMAHGLIAMGAQKILCIGTDTL